MAILVNKTLILMLLWAFEKKFIVVSFYHLAVYYFDPYIHYFCIYQAEWAKMS
jgi:hypothetical protein